MHTAPKRFQRLTKSILVPRNRRNREQNLILDQGHDIQLISHRQWVEIVWKITSHLIAFNQTEPKRRIDLNFDLS